MKSRLFVVNEDTLNTTVATNIASIFVPPLTGAQWVKTISDLMADMLQIEIGDYIFLWETRSNNQKSRIHGVYRAISKPYYQCTSPTDNAPLKIHIEKAYDFANPVDEYDVLNNPYIKSDLWTIIGKKVAGKSRGTTPLSPKESGYLITLLDGLNPNATFVPWNPARIVTIPNPLVVTYLSTGANTAPASLNAFNPNLLHLFDSTGNVVYEKVLETILNQEMTNRNSAFFSPLGIDTSKVIWYSNYLPYSVEQSEMDYVVIESEDGIHFSKVFVIELMKTGLDNSHIHRSLLYSKWVNETLCLGSNIVNPIIICRDSVDFINGEASSRKQRTLINTDQYIVSTETLYRTKPLEIFTYDFSRNPIFEKKR